MNGWATVALPIRNGERYLDEVLGAVRRQEVDREVELLIVDSGSTDRTIEIAESHGATVHRIARGSFSHGATRNLIMELAKGDHVAFLTDDATPAHEGWLQAHLDSFEEADDVALAWGPQRPRPSAPLAIRSELERWFANWESPDGSVHVQRLDRSEEGMAAYRAEMWRWQFFSDVNSCVARWAWERIPFRAVPISEDQVIGREMIEAGYAKVYNPRAAVLHSHDYPPIEFFRRYFEEWRGLRETLGVVHPAGLRHGLDELRHLMRADRAYLRDVERVSGVRALPELARCLRHHGSRVAGSALGTRADRLPPSVRRTLSLERRESFVPYVTGDAPELERPPEHDWRWDFVRRAFPRRPLVLESRPGGSGEGPLSVRAVVSPWRIGSSHHDAVFQILHELGRRGHACRIHVFDPFGVDPRPAEELQSEIEQWFTRSVIPLERGLEGWAGADVALATDWPTAFAARDLPGCAEKVYLVQHLEPDMLPPSAPRVWAEEALRMGYRCLVADRSLEERVRERYGTETARFVPGTDLVTYRPGRDDAREPATVALYAGDEAGRTVELAVAALALLKERRPEVRVVAFGADAPVEAPFTLQDLGRASPARLLALYQQATLGVSLSLAGPSPATREMMASRVPVVELAGGDLVAEARPEPDAIAGAIERLLDDPRGRQAMADRALESVAERTWTAAGEQVEAALRGFLAAPRDAPDRAALV